jgi:ribosomal protein S27AE
MNPVLKMICPRCGSEMNLHGEKIIFDGSDHDAGRADDETLFEFHACPACGAAASRPA